MTDFLADALASRPDQIAVSDGRRRWTFAELDRAVQARTDALREHGAGPGGAVVVESDLSLETLVTLHAAFRSGALVAPLDPRLAPRERDHALATLRPTVVVSSDALTRVQGASALPPAPSPPPVPGPHAPIAVLMTSGTSGRARGVLLSENGFRASAEAVRRRLDLLPTDVWYASLQPSHIGGLALLLRAALLGCALEVRGRFSIDEFGRLLDEGAVTHASLVPTMLRRLLDARSGRPVPASLRALLLGGARTPADLLDRAVDAGYPVALTYGLTEATSQVATAPPDLVRRAPHTVGRPLDGVEVRIGSSGQIEIRGATLAVGVLGGERLTDDEGWLVTDDLGRLDEAGRLSIVGRRSDRIISGGVNVDPHEVEATLRRHPRVDDACVVGLPDESWGERVAALVVAAETPPQGGVTETGVASTGTPEALSDALLAWTSGELSAAKRPRLIRVVDRLPLNANGKVDREEARKRLSGSPPGADLSHHSGG